MTTLPPGWKIRHSTGRNGTFTKAFYDAAKTCVGQYTFDGYGISLPWRVGITGFATQDEARNAVTQGASL